MSTPEDQAVEPTENDVANALDSLLGVDTSASRAARAGTEVEAPAGVPAEAPETPAPAKYTVAGRDYADEDALIKALENANQLISQRQAQPEPDVESVEEEVSPWEYIPGVPQEAKTALRDWALDKPLDAGIWAWEHRNELPPDIAAQVVQYARDQNPLGWEDYRDEQARAYADERASSATAGFLEQEHQRTADAAEAAIIEVLGEETWKAYEPRINEMILAKRYIQPEGGIGPHGLPTPDALKEVALQLYEALWLKDNYPHLKSLVPAPGTADVAPAAAAEPARNPDGTFAPSPDQVAATSPKGGAGAPASEEEAVKAAMNRVLGLA